VTDQVSQPVKTTGKITVPSLSADQDIFLTVQWPVIFTVHGLFKTVTSNTVY
jgi:hypothetical protein